MPSDIPVPLPPNAPPFQLAAAPVAPGAGVVNTLAPPGLVLRIHSDYDRNGGVAGDDAEAQVRCLRPGAIILPNLDISDPTRLPAPGAPARDLTALLDFNDTTPNGTVDESQLTLATLEFVSGVASRAETVGLRIDSRDAARIRAFLLVTAGPFRFSVPVAVLGDGTAEVDLFKVAFPPGIDVRIMFEALAPAGDPSFPAPLGGSPRKANPFSAKLPAGSSGAPLVAKRAPGDIWVEVVHKDGAGKELSQPRDVALFTIAPFLFLSGTLPPKRVFVVDVVDVTDSAGAITPGNHNFVFDLAEACQAVFGAAAVPLPPDESAPFTPATPAHTGPFYLIDGQKVLDPIFDQPDPWIQDEIEIGYFFAPHAWMHAVLHCKRSRGLDKFVHEEMPALEMGVYDGLHAAGSGSDAVHYGGNIEATPPIAAPTPALAAGAGGPAVKAHGPAPFGKILLGDSRERSVDRDFREFLTAQHVQPVLPIDTSWLAVGHVDEIVSFVADGSAKGFKMLFASINAMSVLLEEVTLVLARAHEIAAANPSTLSQLVAALTGTALPLRDWLRVQISDGKVDVLEAYILSVLGPLGVTVHFVDDWFYHYQMGDTHCATNCMRELLEGTSSERWWDKYNPIVNFGYKP